MMYADYLPALSAVPVIRTKEKKVKRSTQREKERVVGFFPLRSRDFLVGDPIGRLGPLVTRNRMFPSARLL